LNPKKVLVRIFGEIARIFGSTHIIEIREHSSILSVIHKIQRKVGSSATDRLGSLRIGSLDLTIMINGKNIDLINGVKTIVHDKDDIIIMPHVVGG